MGFFLLFVCIEEVYKYLGGTFLFLKNKLKWKPLEIPKILVLYNFLKIK